MKSIICAALLSSAMVAGAYADEAGDERQLVQFEQTWQRAWSQGDRVTLDALIDDAYVGTTLAGEQNRKIDVVTAPPPPASAVQVLSEITPRVTGDTAVVTGNGRYTEAPGSRPILFKFMDVFVRRDGKWRVVASQMCPGAR